MFGVNFGFKNLFDLQWQGTLSDYVTALAWSPVGNCLAASSAAGDVVLWTPERFIGLQAATGESIDSIAFSPDGQFLAAGGQDGQVRIWRLYGEGELGSGGAGEQGSRACRERQSNGSRGAGEKGRTDSGIINYPLVEGFRPIPLKPTVSNAWIEHLAWSPVNNQLAYSVGRSVEIWDVNRGEVTTTLHFEASSVLGIDWRPDGEYLAVCGHRGVKVWKAQNWQDEPYSLDIRAASLAIAWSRDGKYLASGNLDRTLVVMEWNNPDPWIMRGFAGKIRRVSWSEPLTVTGSPLLAAACAQSIALWEKQSEESGGWEARVLEAHEGTVQAIAFQPSTFLLASAADDGYVCLWHDASAVAQILEGAPEGFSVLAWHPQGQQLAAGGQNGELLVWSSELTDY